MPNRYLRFAGCLFLLMLMGFSGYCLGDMAMHKAYNIPFFIQQYILTDTGITPQNHNRHMVTKDPPKRISSQFNFTEGPASDRAGNIFFTDQPNDKIWEYSTDGKLSVFLEKTGRSNGMDFDGNGNLVTCADEHNEIWSIDPQKKVTVLMKEYNGHRLNGPNDLWVDAKGGIYFTDPYYQRPYWQRQKPDLRGQNVYYLPKGETEPIVVVADLVKPNGIVGTPDGKQLFVADIGDSKTYKYVINENGTLRHRQLFVAMGSDGMTLDEKGNLYITGDGVTVFDNMGKKIEHIPIAAKWTGNVCFGGKENDQLFITASESIYIVPMRVKGAK